MPKEILLYTGIHSFTAEMFIEKLEEYSEEKVVVRENCLGGDVFSFWGMAAKIAEHGDVTIKVDGGAMSGGANLLLYAKRVECLDASTFMFHRAEGGDKELQAKVNADLKAKMLKRVTNEEFKAVTGYTIDEMYNEEEGSPRIDIFLNAKEAKRLKIVNQVNPINPTEYKAFAERFQMAAEHKPETQPSKNTTMTIDELKSKHPELYAEVKKEGVTAERDRAKSWAAFMEIDPQAAKKGIEDGEPLSQSAIAEFTVKSLSAEHLSKIKKDGKDTPEVLTEEQKQEAAKKLAEKSFMKDVNANLGRKVEA